MCGGNLCIFLSIFLSIFQRIFFFLLEDRRSYFRMIFCSFHVLPMFLLAQILMRADLGDEPEHPLEVVIQPSGAGRHREETQ